MRDVGGMVNGLMEVSAFAGVATALDLLRLAAHFVKALVLLLDHFELCIRVGIQ